MKKSVFVLAFIVAAAIEGRAESLDQTKPVPEPTGYWTGPMHSRTPASVTGGTVIDGDALAKLKQAEAPVIIDVANHEQKPGGTPSKMLWSPEHLSIPGSTWMPGAGEGRTDRAFDDVFAKRLEELTRGDKDKPIVTFCHPHRWGSYNAAKRAAAPGFKHVYWLRDGAEGWREHHDAVRTLEDLDWKAAFSKLGPSAIGAK